VIPTPEQLEEISRLREGTLQEVPFAALLLALSAHRRTLMVEMRRKQISKKIVLEHGVPIDCRSNLVHETFSRFLVAEGKLAAEDLHLYLGESVSRGLPFGEVLLEHDQITAEDLFRMLQQNLAKKLLDIFSWRDGEFRTHEEVPRPESPLKVRVPQLIVTGITKFASHEEVEAGVVPLIGKKLVLHPNPPFALDEIRLNQHQSQLAVALRSGWRIDELAIGTGLPYEEITRLLYALAMLGVVITADHPAAQAAPRAVVQQAGVAASPARTAAAAAGERRRDEIMQIYLSYRRLDAFDLLGVDEDASPGAVEVRYLEFAKRFAPWTLGGPDFADMEEKARDIFLAGARAYSELLDLEQRNTLLFRRKALREERDRRPPADLLAIKTDLLDPEVQYRKGRALAEAGKFQEAVVLLEFASDCDPQNGLYGAELAYCRYCLAPGQGARALKELQETLRRDPDCGLAVFYAGEVHRQMGNHADAETMLRRAIKMMAPDRRPIEALKMLAAEKRR
jgi:hypothetical protein